MIFCNSHARLAGFWIRSFAGMTVPWWWGGSVTSHTPRPVVPAQAGTQCAGGYGPLHVRFWIPAFPRMTVP